VRLDLASAIAEEMMNSVAREIMGNAEVRAWELKGTLRYGVDYATRVSQYFVSELQHFLVVQAARNTFDTALKDFRAEVATDQMDSTDLILFEKFYAEIKAQLNASFAKKSYSGQQFSDYTELMGAITREMIDSFRDIEVWSLVDFGDIANVAESEIEKNYSVPQGTGNLNEMGKALIQMLEDFKILVSETIPDVADTILSKPLIRRMIDQMKSEGTSVLDEISAAIAGASEKSDSWKEEARKWVDDIRGENIDEMETQKALLAFLQFIHEKLGAATTPSAMADRVKIEADALESVYLAKVKEWEGICAQIESENEIVRERNEKREVLLKQALDEYEAEMAQYEAKLTHYREKMEQRRIRSVSVPTEDGTPSVEPPDDEPEPVEPTKPEPLEPRAAAINAQYPEGKVKPLPEKPPQDPSMAPYLKLRDLLYDKLNAMKERESTMEDIFAKRVLRLQAEGMDAAGSISIDLENEFINHLMSTRIRGLGGLLPRISRVYLRDPRNPELLYLVTYEHIGDNLTVTVGSTFLR
jgi:hypothetical protein